MKNIIKNLYHKIIIERYPKLFRPSSKPFISGDTFRKYADHIFDESTSFNPEDVKKNDTVFINSDLIEVYFQIQHPKIGSKYFLISHNSDRNVDNNLTNLSDDKIIHWFAQNLVIKSNKITSIIPIGLENRRWLKYGKKRWFNTRQEKTKYILSSFNTFNNYKERNEADIFAKKSPIVDIKRFDKPSEYFNEASKYKFVLCPSGNGADTHRLWESQILKSLPILLNSNFSSNLKKLGLPALYLDSWDELISYSKTDLDKIYEKKINNNNNQLIYLDYWKKIIEEKKL
jgi:hypothetical protein